MFVKSFEFQTTDRCNYSIDISPNNDSIFFSLNEKGYILSKDDFLSLKKAKLNDLLNPDKNLSSMNTAASAEKPLKIPCGIPINSAGWIPSIFGSPKERNLQRNLPI